MTRDGAFCLKIAGIALFGLLLSGPLLFAGGRKADGNFTIAFMNDTHNHIFPARDPVHGRELGGAARWATILKDIRREAGEILFLHAGDMLVGSDGSYLEDGRPDWKRLPAYGYRGLLEVPVFGRLGLDGFTFGNHEFDYGLYWNYRVFGNAPFEVLASNLGLRPSPPSGSFAPSHYAPYKIFTKGKFRIGVIGAVTGEFLKSNQANVDEAAAVIAPMAEKLKKQCHLLVVLSHLGAKLDPELALAVPGIDVIVGGHTHTCLAEPLISSGTIITQTRSFGEFVGRLDLEYKKGVLENYRYRLIPADFSVPEDPDMKAWLGEQLYPLTLERALAPDGEGDASLGAYIARKTAARFPCDAVLIKTAVYRRGLPGGRVSAEDFFGCLWPYRARDLGPEKELSPEQVMDIVGGKAPSSARFLLNSASGLAALIATELPSAVLDSAEAFAAEQTEAGETFYMERFNRGAGGNKLRLVMDLPSWIDLYREGILNDDYSCENLREEIIEVLLEKPR